MSAPHRMTRAELMEAELRTLRLLVDQLRHENRTAAGVIFEQGLRRELVAAIRETGEHPPSMTNEDVAFLVKLRSGKRPAKPETEEPAE